MKSLKTASLVLGLSLSNACTQPGPAMMDDAPDIVLVTESGMTDHPDVARERDVPSVDVPSVDVPSEDVPNGMDVPSMDVPNMDVASMDVLSEDVPNVDVPNVMDVPNAIADTGVCPMGTMACGMMGCVDLQTSNANCGACGTACPMGRSCQAGMCTCNMGTTLCGGACVDRMTDRMNCGACGTACPGAQLCVAGVCRVDCPMPNSICGVGAMMTCVDLRSNIAHCGMCGNACVIANGSPNCNAGSCAVASCNAGFGNCDNNAANGCETNTNTTIAHCGMCGNACVIANGSPSCNAGSCAVASCNAGFGNCDNNAANGCEVNINTTLAHCGGCGMACPMVANGVTTCAVGVCSTTCNAGFSLLGGRCIATGAIARPIAPLSLGDVSLRRPTLRWELPAGTDGAFVELCRDRACNIVIQSLRVVGSSARPFNALPANSVVFWRLRVTVGAATSTNFSPTWLFHVPARDNSNNIDTSSNPHLDVNGDGFDDIVVGARGASPGGRAGAGTASVYHGSAMGVSMAPARVLEGTAASDDFGVSVASAGDVNGDGFGDLVVGAYQADPSGRSDAGTASIYHGSAMGVSMVPARVLEGTGAFDSFGWSVASAGDVNGDGFADVVVGAFAANPGGRMDAGTASVYHGSVMGVAMAPARVLEGTASSDSFGWSVAGAGDVNGDGFGDLVVGARFADPGGRFFAGTASVYHGSAMGVSMAPARVFEGTAADDLFGSSVAGAGDVNGDGFGDLVVGAFQADPGGRSVAGTASVYHGSAMGVAMAPARVLEGTAAGDNFGSSVAGAGDVNGDGFGDLLVGARGADPGGRSLAGTASVYHGSAMGVPMAAARVLEGTAAGDNFGNSVASAGDVNGDGFSDLLVGAPLADPGGRNLAGTASVYHGSAMGVPMAAVRVLEGAAASDSFGCSVASLDTPLSSKRLLAIRSVGRRSIARPIPAPCTTLSAHIAS